MEHYSLNDISQYPSHIFLPRGMLSLEEVMMLYDLAKNKYKRQGDMVNAGAFIGASAYSLAAGMCDNDITSPDRCIHSYDLFVASDESVVDFLQNNIFCRRDRYGKSVRNIIEVELGFDYYEVYEYQIHKYAQFIKNNKGDIKRHKWTSGPIEILFIDVCKTLEINSYIYENFFPSLMPGVSLIIQQDFHHIYHPYIHVTLQAIKDYIRPVCTRTGSSRVYDYVQKIPDPLMEKIIKYNFSIAEIIDLFNDLLRESPDNEKPLLHVAFINELKRLGEKKLLKDEIKRLLDTYDTREGNAFWYRELLKIVPDYKTVAMQSPWWSWLQKPR